jgi:hypothetical protein
MTKLWGPLGWMTLHSVSLIYPEQPDQDDITNARLFLELFSNTISCNTCKTHFQTMYSLYKSNHPEYLNSRQDFSMFIFRAHNTVNKRLDKPIHSSVSECMQSLELATRNTSFREFRNKYIEYLISNWRKYTTGEGLIMLNSTKALKQLNEKYWNILDKEEPIHLSEGNVLEFILKDTQRSLRFSRANVQIGFIGGKLKLNRR